VPGVSCERHEIETYAMAKLGSMTKQMPKATGTRGQLRGDVPKGQRVGGSSAVPPTATYADLGLNKKTISKAQQLADLPATAITAIASGEKTFAKVRRERTAQAVAEKVSLPGEGGLPPLAALVVVRGSPEFTVAARVARGAPHRRRVDGILRSQ